MTQLLISHADLISGTTLESNVKANLTTTHIENAQFIYIKKFLGTAYYDSLLQEVYSIGGTQNLTGITLSLYNYIKPMLINYTMYMAMPFLPNRISEKGINVNTSDNTKEADDQRLSQMRTEYFNLGQEYQQQALVFLRNNSSSFPLWREDIYYSETNQRATNSSFYGGIQFDRDVDWYNEIVMGYRRGDLL